MVRYAGKRLTAKKIAKEINKIPHEKYVEPMVGLGHVFFAKEPSKIEILNDLDCGVVKAMKRDACKNPKSKKCERLKNAKITCGIDYKKIVKKHDKKGVLTYLDPPYEGSAKPKYDYKYNSVPFDEVSGVLRKMKGTGVLSYDPRKRKDLCGGKIKCRTIPFKFWGNPRKDLLAIKR